MAHRKPNPLEKVQEAVDEVQRRYPHLAIRRDASSLSDGDWTIPVQPGVRHEILIYVSRDELSFDVGSLHTSFFPCDEEEPRAQFVDAVTGFIDGRYRVREHHRRGACIAADLGELKEGRWRSVASWSCLHWPFPRKKDFTFLQNVDEP
jgi:hypothetical protein